MASSSGIPKADQAQAPVDSAKSPTLKDRIRAMNFKKGRPVEVVEPEEEALEEGRRRKLAVYFLNPYC